MDEHLADSLDLPLVRKPHPVSLSVIDGRLLPPVQFQTKPIPVEINGHVMKLVFNIIRMPHFSIVLGMEWLDTCNPSIDWHKRAVTVSDPVQVLGISADFHAALDSQDAPRKHQILATQNSGSDDPSSSMSTTLPESTPYAVTLPGPWDQSQHLNTWHHRLCHRNVRDIKHMAKRQLTNAMEFAKSSCTFCDACALGKAKSMPYPSKAKEKDWRLNERINVDECGPLPVQSIDGERYFITFSEKCSRAKFTYFLHRKNEALAKFRTLKLYLENRTERKIKILYGDNDSNFVDNNFQLFLSKNDIEWQSTVPYSSTQNSPAERSHLTLMDAARAMLIHARLPKQFWGPAILTAAHVHNICPHPSDNTTTPHELLTRSKPDIRYLRVFGCDAFAFIPPALRTKLDPRAWKGIFIGYATNQKGYLVYNPSTSRTSTHRSAVFNEQGFGNRDPSQALSEPTEPESNFDPDYIPTTPEDADEIEGEQFDLIQNDHSLSDPDTFENRVKNDKHDSDHNNTKKGRPHRITRPPRRLGDQVHHGWIYSIELPSQNVTPRSYNEAMSSRESRFWKLAIEDEINSLLDHRTWKEVDFVPAGHKAIGCRWLFKTKVIDTDKIPTESTWILEHHPNGTSTRYKARLVIQGFRQVHGLDYTETYAPVMRTDILRLMMALSIQDTEIIADQMDVVTAFLNAHLTKDIYMNTPQGLSTRAKFVKLLRSLYGLKQAPLEWFKVMDSFLVSEQGFTRVKSTTCLYFKRTPEKRYVMVGVYVDDLPIIGHPELVNELKQALSVRFEMSDFGTLKSCIGIEIARDNGRGIVFMSQTKHTCDILKLYGMDTCKPQPTPADTKIKLDKEMCPKNDADLEFVRVEQLRINYRSAVGALIWLLHTRPDISYAIGEVARYVQNPGPAHFVALKRIFRYLKGTIYYGLLYKRGTYKSPVLAGYSDSDWAGDLDTRRSTSGYIFMLNGCTITYRTKKQTSTALSSCEAETIASSLAGAEAVWLRIVLNEIGFEQSEPTVLMQDNQGSIAFGMSEINHSKMKHISLRDHYIRDLVSSDQIKSVYIHTAENLADLFTKALSKIKFRYFRAKIGCVSKFDAFAVERGN